MLNYVLLQLPQPLGDRDQPVDGEAEDSEAPLPPNSWLEQVSEVVMYPRTFYYCPLPYTLSHKYQDLYCERS